MKMKVADQKDPQDKCMMQSAQNADNLARFLLNLRKEDRFIAETAIDQEEVQDIKI